MNSSHSTSISQWVRFFLISHLGLQYHGYHPGCQGCTIRARHALLGNINMPQVVMRRSITWIPPLSNGFNKDDTILTFKHLKEKKIAVAVRTAGHQHSGASSTNAHSIKLVLSKNFRDSIDWCIVEIERIPNDRALIYTSISWHLRGFSAWLGPKTSLQLKDNAWTLASADTFILESTANWVVALVFLVAMGLHLKWLTNKETQRRSTKASDPDMFYTFLGGSPGNFGGLTHVNLEVYRDNGYPGARGLKPVFFYNTDTLKKVLKLLVEMSDGDLFPVIMTTVLASSVQISHYQFFALI